MLTTSLLFLNHNRKLRRINAASFPIIYNDGFYQDIVKMKNEHLNKYAYYRGVVVGAICARVENIPFSEPPQQRLYIMTLAVLAAYRGRDIGSQLLTNVLDYCRITAAFRISEISLHVQSSNQDAIRFYTEKFGFTQGELVENYYTRIDPPHCYLLYKKWDALTG
jgi:N-alpha-acetyltransferase 50